MDEVLIEFAIDGCPPITLELSDFEEVIENLIGSDGEVTVQTDEAWHTFLNPQSLWFRTIVPYSELSEETRQALTMARANWMVTRGSL